MGDLGSGEEPATEKARLLESEASSRRESSEHNPDPRSPPRDSLQRGSSLDDEIPRSLVSPAVGSSPEGVRSEKARGKLREGSVEITRSLERIALAGIGRNRFVPTQEWVSSWQQGYVSYVLHVRRQFFRSSDGCEFRLPLDPVMLVISELLPKVHDLQVSLNKVNTTPAIIDFLASANLSHALPRSPSITPRRFVVSHCDVSRD